MLGQSVSEELHPWKGLTLEQFLNCGLWEGSHTGAGHECEEGARHYELTIPTHSPSTCTTWGWRGGRRIKSEVGPGKKGIEGVCVCLIN